MSPQFDPVQSNFTAGEIAPNILGNFELEKYKQGLNKAENVIIEASGGVRRRGGFKYVAAVKDSSKDTILVEFQYKNEYFYILEFGNLYIRFYRNQAQIAATEVATTYTEAELRELRFTQDEENLYITHKNHSPAKLSRTSHTAWTLEDLEYDIEDRFQAVCWSKELGIFVALSYYNTDSKAWISKDGEYWESYDLPVDSKVWVDICWSSHHNLFCAITSTTTNTYQVMTSPDGKTWTLRESAETNWWTSICVTESGYFVAVARDGTNRCMDSLDGITWAAHAMPGTKAWSSVCFSETLSWFVAVSSDAHVQNIASVINPQTGWTLRTGPFAVALRSVCWSPELYLFVAVGYTYVVTNDAYIVTSPDHTTWTSRTPASELVSLQSVVWSPELSLLVVVGEQIEAGATVQVVMYSGNGITWTLGTVERQSYSWVKVVWSPKLLLFVMVSTVGSSQYTIATSSNGINWYNQTISGIKPIEWDTNNYPTLCWFFQQRFFCASTPNEPNKVWGSQSTRYNRFDVGTGLDNEGISVTLKDAKKLLWVTVSNTIVLGASNGIFKLDANNLNEAITPTNIRPIRLTNYGCSSVPALDIAGNVVFLQKGLRKLRKLEYEYVNNRYTAIDFLILGNHLTKSGLTELKYIDEPEAIIYGVRTDGQLMGIAYEPEFKIFGGFRHIVGGTDVVVKSIAVSDAISADKDELWAIISRTIDGSTVQYVEFLTQGLTAEGVLVDATFIDSFVTKTGAAFTVFDGLSHLEGETVQVFADGVTQATKVVASGQITITSAVKAHAGLQQISTIETLPMEGGNPVGSAMGKIKRISKVILRVLRSLGITMSDLLGNTSEDITFDSTLFTGDSEELDFYGTYETGGQIKIVIDDPVPFNLLAIMYKARTGE